MFEMATGCCVINSRVILSRQEYKKINDSDTRKFIQNIFEIAKKDKSCKELMSLVGFNNVHN